MNDSSPVMFATAWRICEGGICKESGKTLAIDMTIPLTLVAN